jgi:hypothetical protein
MKNDVTNTEKKKPKLISQDDRREKKIHGYTKKCK